MVRGGLFKRSARVVRPIRRLISAYIGVPIEVRVGTGGNIAPVNAKCIVIMLADCDKVLGEVWI